MAKKPPQAPNRPAVPPAAPAPARPAPGRPGRPTGHARTPAAPPPAAGRKVTGRKVDRPRGRGGHTNTGHGFTRRQAGGPAAHKEAVRLAAALEPRLELQRKAWRLFVAGATFDQVGEQLKVSGKTAWEYCMAVRERMEATQAVDAATVLMRQLEANRGVFLSHWPKRHQKESAKVLVELMKHEARLLRIGAYGAPKEGPASNMPPVAAVSVVITMPDNGRDPTVTVVSAAKEEGHGVPVRQLRERTVVLDGVDFDFPNDGRGGDNGE